MNLWTDSERKWAVESESKPEIEEKHLLHKVISELRYLKLYFPWKLTNSSPVDKDKVFNFIKINESLD